MGANSASRNLVTGEIDRHIIQSLFGDVIGYEENSPINIITSPLDSMCLKFNNSNKLKLQYGFTTPWNLEKNIVAYFSFLKNNQDKLLKWKVTCADAATVVQDVSQMEVSN